MKNILYLFILICLSSCIDKDQYICKYSSTYEKTFVDSFGEIPDSQSWDFYGINTTRAYSMISYKSVSQPSNIDFTYWQNLLKSGENNAKVGTHNYSLISNGSFFVYPVWYAGWYEVYAQYNFEFGIYYNNVYTKLFNGCNDRSPVISGSDYARNPGYGMEVNIPKGEKFQFYIRYTLDRKKYTYLSNSTDVDCSSLLYSNKIDGTNQIMVIGFEDQPTGTELDFNDVILYLKGNSELPIPESKRFMCEDLGNIGDFDFNDAVFDIQPLDEGNANVIIQACGGTLPIVLYVNNIEIGELHSLLNVSTSTMANTGVINVNTVTIPITVPQSFDLNTFTNVYLNITYNDGTVGTITFNDGKAPCIIATPISTQWMKETICINNGYPNFFKDNWMNTYNSDYLY